MTTIASTDLTREIPGPSPFPVLGWLPMMIRFAVNHRSTLMDLRERYGDIIKLGYGKTPAIVVFDPASNRHILRDPSVFYTYDPDLIPIPFPDDSSVKPLMTGLPLMNGERHNDHRAYLLPYFHRKFITRYHSGCVEVTEKKLASWKAGQVVDVRAEMEQLAMWLCTKPVLGLDPEGDGEQVGRQLERTMNAMFSPLALLFPYDIPGLPFHRLITNANEMEKIIKGIIARKKAEGVQGQDILSLLMQLHEQEPERLNERELIGHTTTMFRGGYNPNGMALYWAIFLLSQYPDALRIVLEELEQVLAGNNPAEDQLENLPFLEGVIKETMRLFPAGTWTARLSMEAFELGGHQLPKGTWVVLSPYVTHRIPEIFPEPFKFKPERWLTIHPSSYEFMSFSGGPRYCIGTSLGMMQLKIALSMIIQRFRFTLKQGTKVDCVGLNAIRPKNGLLMNVHNPGEELLKTKIMGNVRKIVEFA